MLTHYESRQEITAIWWYAGINSVSFKYSGVESKTMIPLNAHLSTLAENMSLGEWLLLQKAIRQPNQWVEYEHSPIPEESIFHEQDTVLAPSEEQERWVIHSLKVPASYLYIAENGFLHWCSVGDRSPTIFDNREKAEMTAAALQDVEITPPPYDCMLAVAMDQAEKDGVDAKQFGERLAMATCPVELRPYVGDAGKRMAVRSSARGWFLTLPFGREILEHETPK